MKIALSLSGGGFRATLFHLGVIRYLRDIGLLEQVHTITCVSGGAIFGAHLVHHWDDYTGDDEAFLSASKQIINFTKKDVRGRILRRAPWNALRSLFPNIFFSRTKQFELELKELYSGKSNLLVNAGQKGRRNKPELYILTTNLTLGGSCSFHPSKFHISLPMQHRSISLDTKVLTTPFAVSASAAFPGFFQPISVTKSNLGTTDELPEHHEYDLTDGGVYDNLGIRKIQQLHEQDKFELILMSDAGATFQRSYKGYTGILSTALRAADMLTHRVGQLEYEKLSISKSIEQGDTSTGQSSYEASNLKNLIIMRITDIVDDNDAVTDGTPIKALQNSLHNVRTDLDKFSDTEIRWLIRHGFTVARQALKASERNFDGINSDATMAIWDPMTDLYPKKEWKTDYDTQIHDRKILQSSGKRRIRIFAINDWISWVNVSFILLGVIFVFGSFKTITTQSEFLSEVYPSNFGVTLKYKSNAGMINFKAVYPSFEQEKPDLFNMVEEYLAQKNDLSYELKEALLKDGQVNIERLERMNWLNNAVGHGQAYLSRTEGRWQGSLYYKFPGPNQDLWWFGTIWDHLLGNIETVVMDFDGWQTSNSTMCVRLYQHGETTFDENKKKLIYEKPPYLIELSFKMLLIKERNIEILKDGALTLDKFTSLSGEGSEPLISFQFHEDEIVYKQSGDNVFKKLSASCLSTNVKVLGVMELSSSSWLPW